MITIKFSIENYPVNSSLILICDNFHLTCTKLCTYSLKCACTSTVLLKNEKKKKTNH